jgi:DnaJ-class molecular chaperone
MSENHYKNLGLEETASKDEIKKAFRTLSLKYHPDRNPNNQEAVDNFHKINNAYEVLSDDQKKKDYDTIRKNPFMNPDSNLNMDDILSSLFGMGSMSMGSMNMGGMNMGGMNMGGMPINMNMGGMGSMPFGMEMPFGMGLPPGVKIHVMRGGPQGFNQIQKPPPIMKTISITMEQVFNGTSVPIEIERFIMESGIKVFEKETIYITIPKGIDDGEIITLKDKGNSFSSDNKGEIKVNIKIENNTSFERSGVDLLTTKTISLKEALCGFTFDLKYINGKVYTLNNNSGNIITPNYKKIISNMGLTRDGHTGNLIITFVVEFPTQLTEEKMKVLREIL